MATTLHARAWLNQSTYVESECPLVQVKPLESLSKEKQTARDEESADPRRQLELLKSVAPPEMRRRLRILEASLDKSEKPDKSKGPTRMRVGRSPPLHDIAHGYGYTLKKVVSASWRLGPDFFLHTYCTVL